jgi:hydrogenase nickel incorporation protein HypA/HybF
MHEMSIIQQVVNTLDSELSVEEKQQVSNIILHLGELSNVQPILLENAFKAYQEASSAYVHTRLTVEQIPVVIHCDHCGEDSRVKQYIFKCNNCGKPSTNLKSGEELLIHKIEFFDPVRLQ